ncbi:PHB depolymerase family esterase [Oligella ureolytica]
MVFNPFITGASNFIKQTQVFYDMQKEFLNSARHLLPANFQSSDMTVLHPDPVDERDLGKSCFYSTQKHTQTICQ